MYVILQPHSLTNPTARYRLVDSKDWARYADSGSVLPPALSEHDTYADAAEAQREANGSPDAVPETTGR